MVTGTILLCNAYACVHVYIMYINQVSFHSVSWASNILKAATLKRVLSCIIFIPRLPNAILHSNICQCDISTTLQQLLLLSRIV